MSRIMTTAEAIKEARRCLNCTRPTCRTGCPIENNIPEFIRALGEGIFYGLWNKNTFQIIWEI